MEKTRIQQQIEELEQAIAAQEQLRGQLSDAVLDSTIATLQEKCANLRKALSQTTKERKWVTILFADVAGSTAIAETMDPEVWADIIDAAFEHFIQPVERCKGLVARLMGDAILAFFGAEKSHPEDPKLAVSAGLMMLHEIQPLRERVARDYGLDFQIRVGINTGEVLLGQFGTEDAGEFTAMGDAVNLASRLEHAAPPGHVLMSKETLDLLDDSFEIQPFQEIQFKGKSSAMATFLVKGRRSQTAAANTPILTPFVGREQELSLMQKIIQRASKKNSPQVLTLLGEAGVGKSRLLKEGLKDLPDESFPNRLQSHISPESEHIPRHALQTLFWNHAGVLQSDSHEKAHAKIQKCLKQHLNDDEVKAACIFLGLQKMEEQQSHLMTLGRIYLLRYCVNLSQDAPTLIVLEDLHWSDQATVDFLLSLLKQAARSNLLIIALARPSLIDIHPAWMTSLSKREGFSHRMLQLSPLKPEQTRGLVLKMLGQIEGIPNRLCHLIQHMTNGNPFYVEALLRMFMDEGLIRQENGRWVAYLEHMNTIHLPRTLKGVLQARLDRLSKQEKQVLQQAAVVGAVFWDEVLQQLGDSQQLAAGEINQALQMEVDKGLVKTAEKTSFEGTREFLFKHALLRDTAYETVLLKDRRTLHRQVAEWLLVKGAARMMEYVGLIAYHYEKSEADDLALPWLEEAAQMAMQTSAYFEAVYYFKKALSILESQDLPEKRLTILDGLSAAYDRLGRYQEAFEAALEVNQKAQAMGLDTLAGKSASRLSWLTQIQGKREKSLAWAEQSLTYAEKTGDKKLRARALTNLAGKYEDSDPAQELALYEKALNLLKDTDHRLGIAVTYLNMGNACYHLSDYEQAKAHYQKSQAIYTEVGNLWGIENCMGNIGMILQELNKPEEAEKQIRKALKIAEDIGDQEGMVIMHLNLGYLGLSKAELTAAKSEFMTAMNLGWNLSLIPLVLDTLCGLCALLALQHPKKAQRLMGAILGHQANNIEIENNARTIIKKHPDVFKDIQPLEEESTDAVVAEAVTSMAAWLG